MLTRLYITASCEAQLPISFLFALCVDRKSMFLALIFCLGLNHERFKQLEVRLGFRCCESVNLWPQVAKLVTSFIQKRSCLD